MQTEHATMKRPDAPVRAAAATNEEARAATSPGRRTGGLAGAPRRLRDDTGAATAEYLVATMAAVGFAGLLIVILRGDEVRGILTELVRTALSVG